MASTELRSSGPRCDYPGCGTELKPLFSSLYCPNEDNHGKVDHRKDNLWAGAPILSGWPPFTAFLPACTHHYTVTTSGVTKCLTCGEELTTPYP